MRIHTFHQPALHSQLSIILSRFSFAFPHLLNCVALCLYYALLALSLSITSLGFRPLLCAPSTFPLHHSAMPNHPESFQIISNHFESFRIIFLASVCAHMHELPLVMPVHSQFVHSQFVHSQFVHSQFGFRACRGGAKEPQD
jgi:hypothetical protein